MSYEGLRGEAYRQGALSDRVRDRETVSTGELDTGIHDLISWCRCGGRTASLGTRDCVTWTVSWQRGLSGSSHQSYLVLGVCFCQVGMQFPRQSVPSETEGGGMWVGHLHARCPDTPGSGARPWIVRCLLLYVPGPWSLALGHDVRLTRLALIAWNGLSFASDSKEGNWLVFAEIVPIGWQSTDWHLLFSEVGCVEMLQCVICGSISHVPPSAARPGPRGVCKE